MTTQRWWKREEQINENGVCDDATTLRKINFGKGTEWPEQGAKTKDDDEG